MCHRDSNCGAQTCRRCEQVVSGITSLETHKKVEEAWKTAVKNEDEKIAYILQAILRQIGYDYGHRG